MIKIHGNKLYNQSNIELYINGLKAIVQQTFVSKYPINRRWPGHQREKYQREKAFFVSFESDDIVNIKIKKYKKGKPIIRPISSKVEIVEKDEYIYFTLTKSGYYSLELNDYHKNIHIFFNTKSNYVFDENTLLFENGIFELGEIELKSNQSIYIGSDAVVYANIVGENVSNVKIYGNGILDNSKSKEKILFKYIDNYSEQIDVGNAIRKNFIYLKNCRNILIDGLILNDSLLYNMSIYNCEKINIQNIKILGCWRYNSDGIDFQNSSDCSVTNCFIRTFDDCICVKGVDNSDLTIQNIAFKQCTLWCDWGHAVEIGYETNVKEIKNIYYEDLIIIHSSFDYLNIGCVDKANIHDIYYDNIIIEITGEELIPQYQNSDNEKYSLSKTSYEPVLLSLGLFHHFEYSKTELYGSISRIYYRNIIVKGGKQYKLHFEGANEKNNINDIEIDNFIINNKKINSLEEFNIKMKHLKNIVIK